MKPNSTPRPEIRTPSLIVTIIKARAQVRSRRRMARHFDLLLGAFLSAPLRFQALTTHDCVLSR